MSLYQSLFQELDNVCYIWSSIFFFQPPPSSCYIIKFFQQKFIKSMKRDKMSITRKIFVDARTGDIENHYTFEKVIGKGGFATVWLATSKMNPSLRRAIKIISKSRVQKSPYLQNQFYLLSKLDHPTIIHIYETFEDERNFYFVLDFCEGGDLFEYLYAHPNNCEKDLRSLFLQMATVIRYCHLNRICHRDIKPQNFLLLNNDTLNLKLIDFGMAFQWNSDMKEELKNTLKKTVGTIYYVAPEVLEKGTYDQKCDVWSLGVILYAMTTASFPFNGKNNKQIMAAIKKGKYDKQNKQLKRVSFQLRDLIDKILKPVNERITLDDIFKHSWMQTDQISREELKLNFGRIRNYKKYSKLKKIAIGCISSQLSESQIVKLGQQFKKLDTNFDGYLQIEEFQRCLVIENPKISAKEIKAIIEGIDLDCDGKINYLEFISSCLENFIIFKKQNMLNAFRILDKNNDGKVSAQELKNLLHKEYEYNHNIEDQQIEQIIKSSDKNNDGLLDFDEFLRALTQR